MAKCSKIIERYGVGWATKDELIIEMECIRRGGQWDQNGVAAGLGIFFHYKEMAKRCWPEDDWCEWDDLMLEECIKATFLGIAGPSSSRKTSRVARYVLCLYWCFPDRKSVV